MAERNNLPRFYRQWGKTRKIAWGTQPRRMKAGDNSSAAYGVNRAGQVVGYTQNQSLPDSAFIYNALNDITTDLNTITLNGGQTAASLNWNLTSAVSINDAGVIVG